MSRRPSVELRMLRFADGPHPGMSSLIYIFDFPDDDEPSVVYLENDADLQEVTKPAEADAYKTTFSRIREAALAPAATRTHLDTLSQNLERHAARKFRARQTSRGQRQVLQRQARAQPTARRRKHMTLLTGPGLIADDLYLLAHDDVSGKPFLQSRGLGMGLAGGLLAELVMDGAVRVQGDQIVLVALAHRADELARSVLDVLIDERDRHTARDWLDFFASRARLLPALGRRTGSPSGRSHRDPAIEAAAG